MLSFMAFLLTHSVSANLPNDSAEDVEWLTLDQALVYTHPHAESIELRWQKEWKYDPDYSFLLTRHAVKTDISRELVRIFLKTDMGYAQVKDIGSSDSLKNTNIFWWSMPLAPRKKVPLIWIENIDRGTAHFTTELVFTIAQMPPIQEWKRVGIKASELQHIVQEIEYALPPAPFRFDLKPGQGFWKGFTTDCNEHSLTFQNWIFNDGDGNNWPTGGYISGTFKIVAEPISPVNTFGPIRVDCRYRIETDSFKYEPKKYEG